jgi:capsular polysaccharide biosynthesis protein
MASDEEQIASNNKMLTWKILSKGIKIARLLPSHVEHRSLPLNLKPDDEALFAHELERSWGPCEAVLLTNLYVLGFSWVQWRYGRIVDGFRPWHGPMRRKRGRLKDLAQLSYPVLRVAEALWVHDDWSGNYFHWLTDVLPKLRAWQEAGEDFRQVLLPEHLLQRAYVRESLALLGFQAISFQRNHLKIDRLIVIGLTAPTGNFRSGLLQRLVQQMRLAGGEEDRRLIYISRADAAKRFLYNEDDLDPVLVAHGIETIQLEGCSLADQIELFGKCKLLVGLHGAGLANMLWMPPGGQVLEIRSRNDSHNNCYFTMASALGHHYSYLQADQLVANQDTCSAELFLDPVLMAMKLEELTHVEALFASASAKARERASLD